MVSIPASGKAVHGKRGQILFKALHFPYGEAHKVLSLMAALRKRPVFYLSQQQRILLLSLRGRHGGGSGSCQADEFRIENKKAVIHEDVSTLPSYSVRTDDVYNWEDKHLRFLRGLQLGDPSGRVPVKMPAR